MPNLSRLQDRALIMLIAASESLICLATGLHVCDPVPVRYNVCALICGISSPLD